ncbi:hypothetical protein BACIH_0783 [Bacillus amyloliquefaciens]|nr:hypothetical protein U471_08100 [Bacillus amyloliquefaciens CC178]QEY88867.1 hypothetical protein BACIT_0918 [Bacillus amyloliquefaciens]QEY92557.1 hypothetical protein BACIH_0783 [Bacillus amyloliquefaciens]
MPVPNGKKKVLIESSLLGCFSLAFSIRFFNSFYQLNKDKRQIGQGQNMKKPGNRNCLIYRNPGLITNCLF